MNKMGIKDILFELLVRLFYGIIIGCVIGVIGGIISGIAGGWIDWAISEQFHEELNTVPASISIFVSYEITVIGIPLGFLIGTITGLNTAIFKMPSIKPFMWAIIASLGIVFGLWFSHLSERHLIFQVTFYLEIALIGLVTGWAAYKYTTLYFAKGWDEYFVIDLDNLSTSRQALNFIGLISGLFFILISTYYYFELLNHARNIPS